ncbi:MAG: YafY family transcriptional regulator [Clostridium lundense]|nr:YafY family transcriptional regulator [Clostridium lundense]
MKLDRLLSITMMLINNDIIPAKDLADKFQVSIRTIYRDIEILGTAGIPVISYQGINGGFGIMEGFKIEKGFLSTQDIDSLTAALKGISTIFQNRKYDDTLNKIQNLSSNKNNAALIMEFDNWDYHGLIKNTLNLIQTAIEKNKVIKFNYTNSSGENLSRNVEPITLILKYNTWYLYGFCRVKNDCRLFKISRIRTLEITDEACSFKKEKIEEPKFHGELNVNNFIDLELKFNSNVAANALDLFYGGDVSFNDDGTMIVKVHCPEGEWIYSTILSFGKNIEILNPAHLKCIIKEKAKEIYNLY